MGAKRRRRVLALVALVLRTTAEQVEEVVVEVAEVEKATVNETVNATGNATGNATQEEGATTSKVINYASMDAGAMVLETSASSSGFQNLLLDDKDKYGITPCAEKKMVVIGLSEDIQAREIVLAQYEKYSSGVREFQVLGSRTFPTKDWTSLGEFEAKFGQGEQSFDLDRQWVRYVKVRFVSHYGDEYSCTLSQIKVHGVTITENFHQDLNKHQEEVKESLTSIDDEDEVEVVIPAEPPEELSFLFHAPPMSELRECLQSLEPSHFRSRMRASRPSSTEIAFVDQYTSIFKTLMDKIKSFEINMTITDLYLDRLHACYSHHLDDLHARIDDLSAQLSDLAASREHQPPPDLLSVQDALVFATLSLAAVLAAVLASALLLCCRLDRLTSAAHHAKSAPGVTNYYHYYHAANGAAPPAACPDLATPS